MPWAAATAWTPLLTTPPSRSKASTRLPACGTCCATPPGPRRADRLAAGGQQPAGRQPHRARPLGSALHQRHQAAGARRRGGRLHLHTRGADCQPPRPLRLLALARQALGMGGWVLGWAPFFNKQVRVQTRAALEATLAKTLGIERAVLDSQPRSTTTHFDNSVSTTDTGCRALGVVIGASGGVEFVRHCWHNLRRTHVLRWCWACRAAACRRWTCLTKAASPPLPTTSKPCCRNSR